MVEVAAMTTGYFNCIYEQVLLFFLVRRHTKQIRLYTDIRGQNRVDKYLQAFPYMTDLRFRSGITHLYGGCKKDRHVCEKLESRLRRSNLRYYKRVIQMIDQ